MAQWVAAGLSAFTQYGGAQSEKYKAEEARLVAEANARTAKETTVADEETLRRRNTAAMGTVRAAAAQSGFDPSSGTLADLQARTAGELELDALTMRYKGDLERVGLEYQGAAYGRYASQAKQQGYLNASAIIGGQVARDYLSGTKINTAGEG